jgi:pantetheine-phosphate adenylyltransferase
MRRAVFPGSFDPFTKGHDYLVRRAMVLFDEILVAAGTNTSKQSMFSIEDRLSMVKLLYKDHPKVKVMPLEGLTVDFCKVQNCQFILRGLRDGKDFDYESSIAQMNTKMSPDLETIFLLTDPDLSAISSTILREILRNKGDVSAFLPEGMPFVHPFT